MSDGFDLMLATKRAAERRIREQFQARYGQGSCVICARCQSRFLGVSSAYLVESSSRCGREQQGGGECGGKLMPHGYTAPPRE